MLRFDWVMTPRWSQIFDTNCSNLAWKVLTYLHILHDLHVSPVLQQLQLLTALISRPNYSNWDPVVFRAPAYPLQLQLKCYYYCIFFHYSFVSWICWTMCFMSIMSFPRLLPYLFFWSKVLLEEVLLITSPPWLESVWGKVVYIQRMAAKNIIIYCTNKV